MSDGRQGLCYTERTPQGYCRKNLQVRLSKKDCCCGLNMGQGWAMFEGDECIRCPEFGEGKKRSNFVDSDCFSIAFLSDEHRRLCEAPIRHIIPGGDMTQHITREDMMKVDVGHITSVNECMLRPDICGKGKCIDTQKGYECVCDSGYRLGKSHVCEG